jgi:hypothetical protein
MAIEEVAVATIVLVHGIAQEQLAAQVLEKDWLPALAGGVAKSGNQRLADRIWRAGSGSDIDVRMAYYGTKFIDDGAQGDGAIDLDTAPLPAEAEQLTEELAEVWLQAAAQSAKSASDRRQAQRELAIIAGDVGRPQGPKGKLGRPALNALARLRWFAPFGMALASRFVWKALTQVSRYLTDDEIRCYAQDQVLQWIDSNTRLVIGHSLGSVVAYEALHRVTDRSQSGLTLMTIGSPLGLKTVVYDRLRPQPPFVPAAVTRWENLAAEDDLVAARLDLKDDFRPAPGSTIKPQTHIVDTGSKPHDITHYLTKPTAGRIVSEALAGL